MDGSSLKIVGCDIGKVINWPWFCLLTRMAFILATACFVGCDCFLRGNGYRRCLRQRSDRLNIDKYYRNPYTPIRSFDKWRNHSLSVCRKEVG